MPLQSTTLKRKCCHFDEILITDCTESCHFDNFRCSQWWKFRQNDDILFECRSIPRVPMPWSLSSPGHQQQHQFSTASVKLSTECPIFKRALAVQHISLRCTWHAKWGTRPDSFFNEFREEWVPCFEGPPCVFVYNVYAMYRLCVHCLAYTIVYKVYRPESRNNATQYNTILNMHNRTSITI